MSKVIQKPAGARISGVNTDASTLPPQGVQGFAPRQVHLQVRRASAEGDGYPPRLLHAGRHDEETIDVEAIQREAFRHGHEEGERAGIEKATARYREAVAAFGQSALKVATLKSRLRREAEEELVKLAFAIARRILRRESSVDPTAVVGLVRGCLEQYNRSEMSRLSVHPEDQPTVAKFFEEHPAPQLELIADPKIPRGGAVFHTTRGKLDARLEAQLEEIEKGLADR